MVIKPSVKKRRNGRVYVICTNPKHKQRQG